MHLKRCRFRWALYVSPTLSPPFCLCCFLLISLQIYRPFISTKTLPFSLDFHPHLIEILADLIVDGFFQHSVSEDLTSVSCFIAFQDCWQPTMYCVVPSIRFQISYRSITGSSYGWGASFTGIGLNLHLWSLLFFFFFFVIFVINRIDAWSSDFTRLC